MANKTKNSVKLKGALELFGESYEIVIKNIRIFAVVFLLPFIGALSSTLSKSRRDGNLIDKTGGFSGLGLSGYSVAGLIGASLILIIIGLAVSLVLQAMIFGVELESAKGKSPSFNQVLNYGKKYWLQLLGLMLLIGFYILVPAAMLGILFFIITTLIGASIITAMLSGILLVVIALFILQHYYLAPYVLLDQDLSIFDALQESSRLTKGHASSIWSIIGLSVAIAMTGILPVLGPIVSFGLATLYSVAPALRYQELKKLK